MEIHSHLLAFLLIIIVSFPVCSAASTGTLVVTTSPSDALVAIDGEPMCHTPCTLDSVPVGTHQVTFSRQDYTEYSDTVVIRTGTPAYILANLVPAPSTGSVRIITYPDGADLFIDSIYRGKTSLQIPGLAEGWHRVLIRKDNFSEYSDIISVAAGQILEYHEYLTALPSTGWLAVFPDPADAAVLINGNRTTVRPGYPEHLQAGCVTVSVMKAGYAPYNRTVQVIGGDTKTLRVSLIVVPETATIVLDSKPVSSVLLDGTFRGSTPLTLEALSPGTHTIAFQQDGFASYERGINLTAGETLELFVTLADNSTAGGIPAVTEHRYLRDLSVLNATSDGAPAVCEERTFDWYTRGHEARITLCVPRDLYQHYQGFTHVPPSRNQAEMFALNSDDREFLRSVIGKIKDASGSLTYDARNDYRNVVAFVQSISYSSDRDTKGTDEYFRYPVETLYDQTGDCEGTAILAAALLHEMGYDVALISLPEHMAVGLACDNCNGYYYPYDGKKYYFLETTGAGFRAGQTDKYADTAASVYPLPTLVADISASMQDPVISENTGTDRQNIMSFSGLGGRYLYIATIIAPEGGHVINAEYRFTNTGGMNDWLFSQYENADIRPGDWQMPYGNESGDTVVEIHKVTNLSVIGDSDLVYDGETVMKFFINESGNVTSDSRIGPTECFNGLPYTIIGKIGMTKLFGSLGINDCTADPDRKSLALSIYNSHDPVAVASLVNSTEDGWTVAVTEDTALDTDLVSINQYVHTLKANSPELNIAAYDAVIDSRERPAERIIEVFVTGYTLENRALDGSEINGWKVRLLELYELKRTTTS